MYLDESALANPFLPGLFEVDIVCGMHGQTYEVLLVCDADHLPAPLLDELKEIGFVENAGLLVRTAPYILHGRQIQDVILSRPGSAAFNAWTPDEAKQYLKALKVLFLRHGLMVHPRRRTLAESL